MEALDRCRRAWERTSPQLVIDGWLDMLDMLDELDETGRCSRGSIAASAPGLVEPVCKAAPPIPAGGLNPGAEPCCGTPEELTAVVPAAADTARPVSSAPYQYDGPGRMSLSDVRGRGQRGV
jgi:hypothetical protein